MQTGSMVRGQVGGDRRRTRLLHRLAGAHRAVLLALVAGVALIMMVLLARQFSASHAAARLSLEERAGQQATNTQLFIETYAGTVEDLLRTNAEQGLADPVPSAERFDALSQMMHFRTSLLVDDQGRVLLSYPADDATLGQQIADRYEHLRGAIAGEVTVSGVVPSVVDAEPVVAFAVPIATESGTRVFSGSYRVSETPLGAYLHDATIWAGESLYLVDRDGNIVESSASRPAVTLAAEDPELAAALAERVGGAFVTRGEEYVLTVRLIEGTPWRLVRVVPSDAFYGPAEQGIWIQWLLFGVFVAVGIASVVMLNRILGQRDVDHRRALRDPLTDLANRRGLDAELAELQAGSSGRPWAALMIDIDHFKLVNDRYGHQRGDEVLKFIAGSIQRAVRPDDLVGRWGGEEFMVIAHDADLDGAGRLAERVREAVVAKRAGDIAVTVSIGYAATSTTSPDGVVDVADASLYAAKESGRDRCATLSSHDAFPAMVPEHA